MKLPRNWKALLICFIFLIMLYVTNEQQKLSYQRIVEVKQKENKLSQESTHKSSKSDKIESENTTPYDESLSQGKILEQPAKSKPDENDPYPPCGEICTYRGINIGGPPKPYIQLRKFINCQNIMKRMAYRNHTIAYPPPKSPPRELMDAFLQHGDLELEYARYKIHFDPRGEQGDYFNHYYYSLADMKDLIQRVKDGRNVNEYQDGGCVTDIVGKYKDYIFGKSGLVIGTLRPWLEAILLAHGAEHLTTLEYLNLTIADPRITNYSPYTFAEKFLDGELKQYDFGASYSSVEHSGLGRYGDPINPYGDLEAMAQAWCMVKPGGFFLVAVPRSRDDRSYLRWNSQRTYGSRRLPHLTANFDLLEQQVCKHHVMILQKPEDLGDFNLTPDAL